MIFYKNINFSVSDSMSDFILAKFIELSIKSSGKVFDQKLTQPGISEKFQLAVMNGLNKARFKPLPKLLRSEAPYRVRLRVIPWWF